MAHGWVWVDFENTPQVLLLEPFVRRLRADGYDVRVTARPQAQTLELTAARNLTVTTIGGGGFVRPLQKLVGGGIRSLLLAGWALSQGRPTLLLCSSRSASFAAWMLRIRGIGLLDYEHSTPRVLALGCGSIWLPDILRDVRLPSRAARAARFYTGLKENLYLDTWRIDRNAERHALGISDQRYAVVARPPADTAHYANDRSTALWLGAVAGLLRKDVDLVVSPRTMEQRQMLEATLPRDPRIRIVERVTPGPGLVAAANLLLGGGGTMNREAAVLGVPVWSTFCGPAPRIDEQLASEGRLTWIRSEAELSSALTGDLPKAGVGRGPYPEGFATIFDDVLAQIDGTVSHKPRISSARA